MTQCQTRVDGRGCSAAAEPASDASGRAAGTVAAQEPHSATIPELLRRQAALFAEAAEISRQIADIQLAASGDQSVMGHMQTEPPITQSPMLSVVDVAELCQVDPKTIRRWRKAGTLPRGVVLGGIVRWRASAIEDWLLAQEMSR